MNMIASTWLDAGPVEAIPPRGARVVHAPAGDIAVFKAADGTIFALRDRCPHKGGPLSQGIVHGHAVTCPLHNWVISLIDGEAQGADKGCTPKIPVKVENGRVLLSGEAIARLAMEKT
jgi:nitrite reductase (NADH) small subunit